MNLLIRDAIAYSLSILARVLTPTLQQVVARLCMHLVSDVPQLDSAWVVRFTNPGRCGRTRKLKIDASLQQYGRFLRGHGHLQGEPGDLFEYWGVIKRNVLYGTFRRRDCHVLAGTGTFVLKISANSRAMSGQCTWYDNALDDVWTSSYDWTRKNCMT